MAGRNREASISALADLAAQQTGLTVEVSTLKSGGDARLLWLTSPASVTGVGAGLLVRISDSGSVCLHTITGDPQSDDFSHWFDPVSEEAKDSRMADLIGLVARVARSSLRFAG